MKELINILCPQIKPYKDWNTDDEQAAISFVIIALGIILSAIFN